MWGVWVLGYIWGLIWGLRVYVRFKLSTCANWFCGGRYWRLLLHCNLKSTQNTKVPSMEDGRTVCAWKRRAKHL